MAKITKAPPAKSKGLKKIKFEVEVEPCTALWELINTIGTRGILVMLQQCLYLESGHKIYSMASLLADEKDAENIEYMMLLIYLLNEKDKLLPAAKKYYVEKIKKAQEKDI